MTTVKSCLQKKSGQLFSLRSSDSVTQALELMRANRIRSVMVIDDGALMGMVSQGDCAIKVLLPGLDPKQTPLSAIMTRNPVTVAVTDTMQHCMEIMSSRNFRHLPVVTQGKVVGMISIGDTVKDIIHQQGDHIKHLETFIKGHGVA
jgi:CBS domain-containing protein